MQRQASTVVWFLKKLVFLGKNFKKAKVISVLSNTIQFSFSSHHSQKDSFSTWSINFPLLEESFPIPLLPVKLLDKTKEHFLPWRQLSPSIKRFIPLPPAPFFYLLDFRGRHIVAPTLSVFCISSFISTVGTLQKVGQNSSVRQSAIPTSPRPP